MRSRPRGSARRGRRLLGSALLAAGLLGPAGPRGAAAAVSGAEEASAAAAREVLSRLDARLRKITTMRGRFVQTFVSAGLGIPQTEKGRFALKRPDLLRWDYSSPEPKTAVSDGAYTWLHLPEEGVVYRGSVAAWRERGAFALLSGADLSARYEAVSVDAQGASRRGHVVLALRPLTPADEFTTLLVEVEPRTLSLASVTAVDGMGNRIGASFSDVEENVPLDTSLFRFTPPAGAKVVDQDLPAPSP